MGQISYWIVLSILFLHWVADFVLQTDEDAKNKSKSMNHLLNHTFTYSFFWLIPMIGILLVDLQMENPIMAIALAFMFCSITLLFHTITDYFTSRLNTRLWIAERVHDFFVSVGFDQWLHYLQLFLTYKGITWFYEIFRNT
jgi:uncharacterized membrane protein